MARRRSGARQRDATHITRHLSLLPQPLPALPLSRAPKNPLQRSLFSDRRLFHPQRQLQPPAALKRPARRIMATRHRHVLKFKVPLQVDLCVRRQRRKEVLHALRLTGKGSRARSRRRNEWSGISCK